MVDRGERWIGLGIEGRVGAIKADDVAYEVVGFLYYAEKFCHGSFVAYMRLTRSW